MDKEITCIICPVGCRITVTYLEDNIQGMEGHQCESGEDYAKQEVLNPQRGLTTTIMVRNGELPLVSVKTNKPVPKGKLLEVMDIIADVVVDAPIEIGDVVVEKVLGMDADIVATKNVKELCSSGTRMSKSDSL